MTSSSAETFMPVGITLRSQLVDTAGHPSDIVETGGALRAHAVNLGAISFKVRMATEITEDGVTDSYGERSFDAYLLLPAPTSAEAAIARTVRQCDRPLKVTQAGASVRFCTIGSLYLISDGDSGVDRGCYVSGPLDVYGTTV